eukprot:8005430-Pyramimonas_sp.AAC.1
MAVITEESALQKRRGRVRGCTTLDQIEKMYVLTKDIFHVPEKQRLHYSGSSMGNCIGPIALPDYDDVNVWKA